MQIRNIYCVPSTHAPRHKNTNVRSLLFYNSTQPLIIYQLSEKTKITDIT